ncbi:MAG: threonine synthase [Ruminococcaceae bacterium]|nr:threonine synthase [Oscillospiraceae bacterium]
MNYKSTRDVRENQGYVSAAEAIKEGLAPDGGLYIPESFPAISADEFVKLGKMNYAERAHFILAKFLDDYDQTLLASDCREAYSEERFPGGAAPLHTMNDGIYSLELWHGPTSAFKDMALQLMPRLLSRALKMTGEERISHILVATSGDTGKAALEGYKDVDGVKITVFYPVDGVSRMQKHQMQTTGGKNTYVAAVRGNFDDTQNGVKAIFSDRSLAENANENGFFFGSANSINWGRLVPQIVYYVSAYCDLVNSGDISCGDKINICVPTGNFGNIFAAYIASKMGLPVNRFICASNSNNVLTDFINTGVYDRTREFYKTISPSMDILISSNLERLISVLGGASLTADLMAQLKENGVYKAPDELMAKIREVFSGYSMNEEETSAAIAEVYKNEHYLIDPHTAVGYGCIKKYREATGDETKTVLASTASPYKFAPAVADALGVSYDEDNIFALLTKLADETGTVVPEPLAKTLGLEVRFTEVLDKEEMPDLVFRV